MSLQAIFSLTPEAGTLTGTFLDCYTAVTKHLGNKAVSKVVQAAATSSWNLNKKTLFRQDGELSALPNITEIGEWLSESMNQESRLEVTFCVPRYSTRTTSVEAAELKSDFGASLLYDPVTTRSESRRNLPSPLYYDAWSANRYEATLQASDSSKLLANLNTELLIDELAAILTATDLTIAGIPDHTICSDSPTPLKSSWILGSRAFAAYDTIGLDISRRDAGDKALIYNNGGVRDGVDIKSLPLHLEELKCGTRIEYSEDSAGFVIVSDAYPSCRI